MINQMRGQIGAIAQGNIQNALNNILDLLEIMGVEVAIADYEANQKMRKVINQGVDENPMGFEDRIAGVTETKLELETLEGENDYVQQNLKEEENGTTEGISK
jgi:hypothetical protein